MGQRYNIHFKNYRNTAYDVKVYIDGYVGQVTELLGARSAFVVEGNDENFVYEPIRSSTATLTLLGSDLLLDLFSINNQYAPVKLFKGDKLMWTGYIVPEQFTQPYKPTPDNISIDCISAIGTLENIQYEKQTENGFITAINLLRYIIRSANGGYEKIYIPYVYGSSEVNYSTKKNIFDEITLAEENFTSEGMMLDEVLEYFCRFFNWTLYDYEGSLYFVDVDWKGEYFSYGEDLVTYEMVTPNTVLLQDIGFGGSDHTIDVLPGYNKVTVKAINNVFDELVDDEGFDVSDMYGSFTNLTDKRNDNKYYKVENVQGLTLERWESIAYGDNGEISQDAIPVMGANLNYNMTGGMTAYRVGEADIDFKGWDGLTPLYTIISENYTWRSLLRYRIISTAVGNPILRVGGVTAVYKDAAIGISADILFTTNYAEPNKVTITEDHVLRFKLRIGDHYWNGNKWQNSETTFTIGIGEVGEEVERTKLRATKKADMPYEGLTGYVIEFPDSVPLTGKFELILYGTDYPYQNDKYIKVVDIENLRVAYKKKDGVTDEGENGDRVYENVVNEKFMSELDEIEFGISSYNEDGATYSKALLNGNFLTNTLYSAIEGTLVRPEEALIRRIINRYRVTKIKLTQVLKNSDLIHPFTVLYDNSMVSKKFMLLSGVWDYEQNTVTLSMIENGDKVRYKNHK